MNFETLLAALIGVAGSVGGMQLLKRVIPDVDATQADKIKQRGEWQSEIAVLRARVVDLETAVEERNERIYRLFAEVAELRHQLGRCMGDLDSLRTIVQERRKDTGK